MATFPRGQHIETRWCVPAGSSGSPAEPGPRLDRLTRGVLMFTVRPEVRGPYQRLFDERVPEKTYEAVTLPADQAPFSPIPRFRGWRDWPAPTPERPWLLRHHMVKERGRLATYLVEPEAAAIEACAAQESRSADASPGHDMFPTPQMRSQGGGSAAERRIATATDPPRERKCWSGNWCRDRQDPPAARRPENSGAADPQRPSLRGAFGAALHDPIAPLPSPPFAGEEISAAQWSSRQRLRFEDPLTGELREFSTIRRSLSQAVTLGTRPRGRLTPQHGLATLL